MDVIVNLNNKIISVQYSTVQYSTVQYVLFWSLYSSVQ